MAGYDRALFVRAAGGAAAGAAIVALASNPAGWVVGVSIFVGAALSATQTKSGLSPYVHLAYRICFLV